MEGSLLIGFMLGASRWLERRMLRTASSLSGEDIVARGRGLVAVVVDVGGAGTGLRLGGR